MLFHKTIHFCLTKAYSSKMKSCLKKNNSKLEIDFGVVPSCRFDVPFDQTQTYIISKNILTNMRFKYNSEWCLKLLWTVYVCVHSVLLTNLYVFDLLSFWGQPGCADMHLVEWCICLLRTNISIIDQIVPRLEQSRPLGVASFPQSGPGVNAQMRTSLSSLLRFPPYLFDRVCVTKACPGRDTNSLLTLCECWPGYLISLPLVKIFFISFGFLLYSNRSTVCCVITVCGRKSVYNRLDPGRIQCLCSSSADVPKWRLNGAAEQKGIWRTVLYNVFFLT